MKNTKHETWVGPGALSTASGGAVSCFKVLELDINIVLLRVFSYF